MFYFSRKYASILQPSTFHFHGVVNGTEVGVIQSKLLGRSVLDLYIGDNPIDNNAKEEVEFQGASLFQNKMIGNETRFGM